MSVRDLLLGGAAVLSAWGAVTWWRWRRRQDSQGRTVIQLLREILDQLRRG